MPQPRRRRTWILFFAALAALAIAAVGIETWYNVRQQLTPETVGEARNRWREHGPADYDLRYTVATQARTGDRLHARLHGETVAEVEADGVTLAPELYAFHDLAPLFAEVGPPPDREVSASAPERATRSYQVQVRRGRPVRAWCEEEPVPAGMTAGYDMTGLLAGVALLAERDSPGGLWRPYAVAMFDKTDGHLLHYVRSRMRTRERVEFNLVELKPVAEAGAAQAPTLP